MAEDKVEALGPPKQRVDWDFRKQKVMTFRTLLLENLLVRYLLVLTEQLDEKISLSCLLELFFKRSGGYVETFREIAYWIDTDGLSLKNKRILRKVADRGLQDEFESKWKTCSRRIALIAPLTKGSGAVRRQCPFFLTV